jgi:tellurite methyltransferase
MTYDNYYKNRPNAWGVKASPIVIKAARLVTAKNPSALDLGAGQGRDSLFLSAAGFQVTALDKSEVGLSQIKAVDNKIKTIAVDIAQYSFGQKYDLIISINVLHFLSKADFLKAIKKIKSATAPNGIIAISILLDNGLIMACELENLFKDLEIIVYKEFAKQDKSHIGAPHLHVHQIAQIIARKM